MKPFDPDNLKAGDHLIYWSPCLADFVIGAKTFTRRAGHIEVYAMCGTSIASRAEGVGRYEVRLDGLEFVLRPKHWNHPAAMAWFWRYANGQKYDWIGLLSFALAENMHRAGHMFCSEFARELDRYASCPSFHANHPADLTPPRFFLASAEFDWIYDRRGKGGGT